MQTLEADEAITLDMTMDDGQELFENAINSVVTGGADVGLDYL